MTATASRWNEAIELVLHCCESTFLLVLDDRNELDAQSAESGDSKV